MTKGGTLDPLSDMRQQLSEYISANYSTVEEFCWAKDLNKATVSNFLRGKKDFQVSTRQKIAAALNARLTICLK